MNLQTFLLSLRLIKAYLWLAVFMLTSFVLSGYEILMKANLFTEGPLGIFILSLILISCEEFLREHLQLAKELQVLSKSGETPIQPEIAVVERGGDTFV